MGSTAKPAPEQLKVKPVPEGYHTVTPYLAVRGAAEAIEFYKKAFGATELSRLSMPDGKSVTPKSKSVTHASCCLMSSPSTAR